MRKEHLYIALLSIIGGVFFGSWLNFSYPAIIYLALLSLVSAILWRRTQADSYSFFWQAAALILFFSAVGLMRVNYMHDEFGQSGLATKVGNEITLVGVVVAEPEVREASTKLIVAVDGERLLLTADRYEQVVYGDRVEISGVLKEPKAFTTEFGRTFDYPGYLKAQGIEYHISFADLKVTHESEGQMIIAMLLGVKSRLMSGIEQALPEPTAGLGEGLLLGVKQALGADLEQAFRDTGIIHIVVLSGYNVMLIVAFILFFLRTVVSAPLRVVLGFMGIIGFALMVGLSATVLRACLMASVLLIAEATGRRYLALRALLVAAALMLMWNPYLLMYDIGFQLSFMATLGLITITPRLERYLAFMPKFIGLRAFLGATIATQIAVLPLLMFHIGQVSIVSIIVNLLVLPMVPVAMLLTFLSGLMAIWLPALAPVMGAFAYASLVYIIKIAETFATVPLSTVNLPIFSVGLVLVSYLLLAVLLLWRRPIGQRLKTERSEIDEELVGWQIIEETDEPPSRKEIPIKKTLPEDLPVFFR